MIQIRFSDLLAESYPPADVTDPLFAKGIAEKLISRIHEIRLYAHSYSFSLNFQQGGFDTIDLLDFAYDEGLAGIDIHIDDGKQNSLGKKSEKELKQINEYATKLGLGINLEVSSTAKRDVDRAIKIAKTLNVKDIRVYIRSKGKLSDIIKKGIQELGYIAEVAEKNDLAIVLEQHEVLTSKELVHIISDVNCPRIGLLFDFGNMINANEDPLDALKTMSPYIHQAHLKGIRKKRINNGYGQVGVPEAEGDLPQMKMLFQLLLLGETEPQVKAYGLEQVVGYHSPPYRSENETKDPLIPHRKPSRTNYDKKKTIDENLVTEKQNARKQVKYVRNTLEELTLLSQKILNR